MQQPSDEERLRRLRDRLAELQAAEDPDAPRAADHHAQAHLAWRMVVELVAGLLVGFAIGYGLDVLFGTRPWLLVIFTLLGFAAGVQTMIRTAREVQVHDPGRPAAAPPSGLPTPGSGPDLPAPGPARKTPAAAPETAQDAHPGAGAEQEEDRRRG